MTANALICERRPGNPPCYTCEDRVFQFTHTDHTWSARGGTVQNIFTDGSEHLNHARCGSTGGSMTVRVDIEFVAVIGSAQSARLSCRGGFV